MQQKPPLPMGPLTTPKAFRRPTGAHAILVSLLLADLAGFLIWLGASTLLALPTWRLLQGMVLLLHASLFLDVGIVLILTCFAFGLLRQHIQKKSVDDAWGCAGLFIILLVAALLLLALLKTSWMTIPAPIPAITPEPLDGWSPQPSLIGGTIVVGLFLLAHLALWRRDRRETADRLLPYSRAHPGSPLCGLLEQAYRYYRRGLTRFAYPSIERLKTPITFRFYPRAPQAEADAQAHPERECSWIGGELVICQAHLGPKPEQTEILWPLVARLLHDSNSPVGLVERLLHLAHLADTSIWRLFLWLPIRVAFSCERHWQALERDRVLDRDRFAWECGEGKRLRKLLCRKLDTLYETEQPDNTVPTLAERIDHLNSLLQLESRQVKELRAALPPAPPAPPGAS